MSQFVHLWYERVRGLPLLAIAGVSLHYLPKCLRSAAVMAGDFAKTSNEI